MSLLQRSSVINPRILNSRIVSTKLPIFQIGLLRTYITSRCNAPQYTKQPSFPLHHYNNGNIFRLTKALYSTKTAPPPPPQPPHDKDAKGKKILNRISRAFTFSLSSLVVLGATGIALLVVYLILSELFLPSGDTRTFNKAVKLVEQNEAAQKTLDFPKGTRLKAHGMVGGNKWVRNRPAQSIKRRGKDGKDHLFMKFQVETDKGDYGIVTLEQIDTSFWSTEFAYIALDIPGSRRIYIIEPKFKPKSILPRLNSGDGFLGLKWGPKKDD
ncbi:TIM21 [[Candida] subhashii]|uniref:Mitochondrial import inner membrane translocase subunit Tim21 n=1 Tax=[Candida] subhashii TaxID=561895 RepID=A0A8J5QHB4_9ASCO|nr:TIM21 [[Candida] subhashii]KAG7662113.1 TIM21 [[Candida] subhashii]